MRYRSIPRSLLATAVLTACSGPNGGESSEAEGTEDGESGESGESADTAETGESTDETGGPLDPLCPDGGTPPLVQFMTVDDGSSGQSYFAPAGARDVDGDGFDDLISYVPQQVLVAWGDFGPTETSLDAWVAASNGFTIGTAAGEAIVSATIVGDVNGDGLADILAFTEEDQCDCGRDDGCFGDSFRRAYLVHGSASATSIEISDIKLGIGGFMLEYDNPISYCGASERAHYAGDVDDDGMLDFVINLDSDAALIFGKTDTEPVSLTNPGAAGYLIDARVVSSAGDVDGDGIDDLVGYAGQDAQVFLGQTGAPPILGFVVPQTDAANNPDVLGIGDFNGDGLGDIAIEDTRDDRWHVAFGRAGSDTVPSADLIAGIGGISVAPSDGTTNRFAMGHVGDVNGDGVADLALTDPTVVGGDGSEWRTYVMYGGSVGAPELCELALGIGGFGIAGTADQPVVRAFGSGLRRLDGSDVIVESIGGFYVVAAP